VVAVLRWFQDSFSKSEIVGPIADGALRSGTIIAVAVQATFDEIQRDCNANADTPKDPPYGCTVITIADDKANLRPDTLQRIRAIRAKGAAPVLFITKCGRMGLTNGIFAKQHVLSKGGSA
jgi:hypothetical protein